MDKKGNLFKITHAPESRFGGGVNVNEGLSMWGFAPWRNPESKESEAVRKRSFTSFEKEVYKCVMRIPLGQVRSYKWVAEKIGKPSAYRAVGRALHKNPFPLIVPCHRVVKTDGSLGGYSGGERIKRILINLEKIIKDVIK